MSDISRGSLSDPNVSSYPPNFGEMRRGIVGVALPLGSVEAIERLARDLVALGFGMGESAPQSSQQLEWHGKAETARLALMENVRALQRWTPERVRDFNATPDDMNS